MFMIHVAIPFKVNEHDSRSMSENVHENRTFEQLLSYFLDNKRLTFGR